MAVGGSPTGRVVQDRFGRIGIPEFRLRSGPVIAVIVMTAEAGIPLALRDQFAMRDIERIGLHREVLVTGSAGSRHHRHPHPLVLTVAVRAGTRRQLLSRLLKSRFKEAMCGMRILIARVTVHAGVVADLVVPEGRVGLAQAEVKGDLGL